MLLQLVYLVVFIVVLSTLRTRLVYELSGTSLLMFGSTRPGILLYSIFVLPGTIIHELSHWIVAEILQVRTGEITILPELKGDGDRERLGSVATERTDPLRGFLIGVAPFITGTAILLVLGSLLSAGLSTYPLWQILLMLYGVMVIGNSMMISREDRRTWPFIITLLIVVGFIIYRYFPTVISNNTDAISRMLLPLNQVLGVTAGFNLVMIGGSYGLRRLIEKITKRRLVHK